MSWLNSERPPDRWSPAYFKIFVERLRTAVNYLDATNFPSGLSGSMITNRSVILKKITGYGGLVLQQDFFAVPTPATLTTTELTSFGSPVLWSPGWNSLATAHLEITACVADASHPATVEVKSADGTILTQQVSDVTLQRYEWPIDPMPTEGTTLVFRASVSDVNYPLTILSARLILKLTEAE